MASEAVVREASAADLPACAAIINDWIDATPWLPRRLDHEAIAALFEPTLLQRRAVWVAEAAGRVVGYLSAAPDGFVPALYLAAAARGQELGRRLLGAAKARFSGGLSLDCWVPNDAALRFYLREGFVEDEAGYRAETDDGVPTRRLRWRAE
jgi:putative acetyltransferase